MAYEDYFAVIAIDFGTTFSGYAFSMRGDKENIKMKKSWGAELGFQAYKSPTTILTNPDGSFNSFGFEAETNFADLDSDDIKEGYQLFQRFKMELYSQEVLLSICVISPVQILVCIDCSKQNNIKWDKFLTIFEYPHNKNLQKIYIIQGFMYSNVF